MYRFFEKEEFKETILLSKENSFHYEKVLRIKEDEEVEVSATNGVFKSKYSSSVNGLIELKKIRLVEETNESSIRVILFQSILKGEKMDQSLKQAVEVGVSEIYPVVTDRTVAKIEQREEKKIARWQRVVESAAKQSKRDYIPVVNNSINLKNIEEFIGKTHFIVPYENEDGLRFNDLDTKSNEYSLLIGPEGGFEEDEIEFLKSIGADIISLGKRILRAETAAVVSSFYIIHNREVNNV